jgi:prephenate dehydrogenase
MELKNGTYGFVGLGLMGGSLAKAIRENIFSAPGSAGKILASDCNRDSIAQARESGILDGGYGTSDVDEMLMQCDFVYVCLYPHATLEFMKKHRDAFKSGAVVSDISGVKTLIVAHRHEFSRDDVDFIPGHPMAGNEKEGFVHSSSRICVGRNYILMPQPETKPENLTMLKELITALGFSRIIETDYRVHDHKIAFTSQLCHVIASALVDSAEDEHITAFGGGSFEDLTRIAMINAPLWTELFTANRDELVGHIEAFEHSLDELKKAVRDNDQEKLLSYLEKVRTRRMAMSRIDIHA